MHTQNKPACDRDCFHWPYPDCILDEDDMSPEEWNESQEREKPCPALTHRTGQRNKSSPQDIVSCVNYNTGERENQ